MNQNRRNEIEHRRYQQWPKLGKAQTEAPSGKNQCNEREIPALHAAPPLDIGSG
jgi:hypothetical protein